MQKFGLVRTPMVGSLPMMTGNHEVSEADGIEMAGRVYRNEAGALAILDVRTGSPERDQTLRTLRRKLAIALIHSLPAKQRFVIVRRYFEDCTLDDIAQELHVTLQSVARMQAIALKRLSQSEVLREFVNGRTDA